MRILAADDDVVSRRLLENTLTRSGYEVMIARTGSEAWQVLEGKDAPPMAILDWMMPGLDGTEICRRIRQRGGEAYTYIIVLTSRDAKEDFLMGMAAGADDYMVKPFDPAELRARVRAGERILTLQQQLLATREALRIQATRDPLTGLWNRGAVLDILERELSRSQRDGSHITVLMVDVDHFKRVNDSHGHLVGDAVLREVGRRIQSSLRPYDALGRVGGEEFLVVAPGCDAVGAQKQAERLRHAVAGQPVVAMEHELPVTISIGIAPMNPGQPDALQAGLHAADTALYRAKRNGRNRCELAERGDDASCGTSPSENAREATLATPDK